MALEPDSVPFANEPLNIDDLPRLQDDNFVPVDPNYLKVSLLGSAAFAVVVLITGITASVMLDEGSWIPLAIMAALLIFTAAGALLSVVEVRHIGYQVRTHDVSYRSGVLIKTVSTVPFVRVQHARISQGPVERRFGIATLEVNSAGPDLSIKGLTNTSAEQLKAVIVERAGDLVEEP